MTLLFPDLVLKKFPNADQWVNSYQRTDDSTLLPVLGLKGHPIKWADSNTELMKADFCGTMANGKAEWQHAHLRITGHQKVTTSLARELGAIPTARLTWKYKP